VCLTTKKIPYFRDLFGKYEQFGKQVARAPRQQLGDTSVRTADTAGAWGDVWSRLQRRGEPRPVDSILHLASAAVPDSAPAASIWPAFLHGAAFGAGMLAAFAAFCGILLAGDAARRRAVARARLRRALAALDAEDIVTLIQQQGNAELRRAAGGVRGRDLAAR
jgi:hypothetical protein